jgi:hypothetical protein
MMPDFHARDGRGLNSDVSVSGSNRRQTAAKYQASAIEAARAGPNERNPHQLATLQRLLNNAISVSTPPWQLLEIARASAAIEYHPGQSVAVEGTLSCTLLIVLRGTFAVCSSKIPVEQGLQVDNIQSRTQRIAWATKYGGISRLLEFWDVFGEHTLHHEGVVHPESLVCLSHGLVLRIAVDDYRCTYTI